MDFNKKLNTYLKLSHKVKVYVPSTIQGNIDYNPEREIKQTLEFLAKNFGGSTAYEAKGYWRSENLGLVGEKVTICESFCNREQLTENFDDLLAYCEDLKKAMSQESLAIEINNELVLI